IALASCGGGGKSPTNVDSPMMQMPDAPVAPAMLKISPTSQSFGTVTDGQTGPATTFTIQNMGGASSGTLAATLIGTDPTSFTLANATCSGQALAMGGSCTLTVALSPTSAGPKSASIQVAATGGTVAATLDGAGVAPGALTISADTNTLGSAVVNQTG